MQEAASDGDFNSFLPSFLLKVSSLRKSRQNEGPPTIWSLCGSCHTGTNVYFVRLFKYLRLNSGTAASDCALMDTRFKLTTSGVKEQQPC